MNVCEEMKVEISLEMIALCKKIDIAKNEENCDKASKLIEALGLIVFEEMESLL